MVTTGVDKFYNNGMDLFFFKALKQEGKEQMIWDSMQAVTTLLARILAFPLPTIAAINGNYHSREIPSFEMRKCA